MLGTKGMKTQTSKSTNLKVEGNIDINKLIKEALEPEAQIVEQLDQLYAYMLMNMAYGRWKDESTSDSVFQDNWKPNLQGNF